MIFFIYQYYSCFGIIKQDMVFFLKIGKCGDLLKYFRKYLRVCLEYLFILQELIDVLQFYYVVKILIFFFVMMFMINISIYYRSLKICNFYFYKMN